MFDSDQEIEREKERKRNKSSREEEEEVINNKIKNLTDYEKERIIEEI